MKFRIKIDPEAQTDIQEAIVWYNNQQKGLGKKFYSEVENSVDSLSINPFYRVVYDQVRCFPLKRYPYSIHFTIEEEKQLVVIRAVFHTSRSPKVWEKR